MIKIEKLKGITGRITRADKPVTLYVGLLLSRAELETLEASGEGVLQYSIDEMEVVTREFKSEVTKPELNSSNKSLSVEATKTTKSGKVIK